MIPFTYSICNAIDSIPIQKQPSSSGNVRQVTTYDNDISGSQHLQEEPTKEEYAVVID